MKKKRIALLLCQEKGPRQANALKTVCPDLKRVMRSFIVMVKEGVISLWTFF